MFRHKSRDQNTKFRKYKVADGRHFKNVFSLYLRRESSDFNEIWCADAILVPITVEPQNIKILFNNVRLWFQMVQMGLHHAELSYHNGDKLVLTSKTKVLHGTLHQRPCWDQRMVTIEYRQLFLLDSTRVYTRTNTQHSILRQQPYWISCKAQSRGTTGRRRLVVVAAL